ncbi:MAG: hypothetical protein KAI24_03200 [Planctomycetes bacterium]|nr:hypothetical protein [Planctomycetota bacterium]
MVKGASRFAAVTVLFALAGGLRAQNDAPNDVPDDVPGAVMAERLFARLAAAETRPAAMHGLWRLQTDALPVLARAVRSKDLEVARSACAVLHDIGRRAAPVRELLRRELRAAEGPRREALLWALHAIEARGYVLTTWDGRLLFVDDDGKVARQLEGFTSAWGVQTLPHGRLLLAQATGTGVRELDGEGEQRWVAEGKKGQPLRAQRLWNGHTLVADSQVGLSDDDASGRVVWQHGTAANCAVRLLNGHTISVTNGSKLIEIDPAGKVVRSIDIPGQAYGVRPLPDGTTMVAARSGPGVIVIDRDGKVLRKFDQVQSPNDCLLLEDGSVLICGGTEAAVVGSDGKKRWRVEAAWVGGCAHGGLR